MMAFLGLNFVPGLPCSLQPYTIFVRATHGDAPPTTPPTKVGFPSNATHARYAMNATDGTDPTTDEAKRPPLRHSVVYNYY